MDALFMREGLDHEVELSKKEGQPLINLAVRALVNASFFIAKNDKHPVKVCS
jgi:hypothetical protein